jgi:hypothetical protein
MSQTRVPEIPDQTEFLERWWEFHHGYRFIKLEDGRRIYEAVTGEPLREVSPGFLPRTLDQLRAGVENDARRPENRFRRRRLSSDEERPEQPHQSLEDALDDLLLEAEEIADPDVAGFTEPPTAVTPQAQNDPTEPPRPMTRPEARLQHARERFARVFGSREEQDQDDYESPLTQMYSRAYDRHRQAEERRAEGTNTAPSLDGLSQRDRRDIEEQLLWGVMRESQEMSESLEPESEVWSYEPRTRSQLPDDIENEDLRAGFYASGSEATETTFRFAADHATPAPPGTLGWSSQIRPQGAGLPPNALAEVNRVRLSFEEELARIRAARPPPPPLMTLDTQPDRPAPKTDEEMTKVLACQVCYQQIADIAVLPCGHMVMCQWCADVVVPVKHGHIPARATKCPMCRKQVKQRFRIHTG